MLSRRSIAVALSTLLFGCAESLFGADGAPEAATSAAGGAKGGTVYTIAVSGTT